ncbi:MAG: hypothetical protein GY765_36835 [bacterium]|nr:hypothetical protein [bacterium]
MRFNILSLDKETKPAGLSVTTRGRDDVGSPWKKASIYYDKDTDGTTDTWKLS